MANSVRILGPVEVWTDGQPVALGGPQQLALFASLVLHADRAVSADVLIDTLWGDERGVHKRLQMAIARLRQTLAAIDRPGAIEVQTVGGGYLLALGDADVDAAVFEAGVAAGQRALQSGDPARAQQVLAEALGLWRGPPLAQLGFHDFAQHEIRRLEDLRLIALEDRIQAGLELGRHSQLTTELSALVVAHPAREALAGQLMLALYRSGRPADALGAFDRTRRHLAAELGLQPGPALVALQKDILNHAPRLAAGESPAGGGGELIAADQSRADSGHGARRGMSVAPLATTPTVGRAEEVRLISGLLSTVGVRLVTLTGPGGVGKTRLAAEVALAVEASFHHGACWVELAGVARADDVPSAVAQSVAVVPVQNEGPREALSRFLANRQFLLVLDNCEHVLDAAGFVAELLGGCSALRVLATSRETLKLSAEHRVIVEPLAVPAQPKHATPAELEGTPAGALFVAAARRHDHHFTPNPSTAPAIAEICARLDGLPLALELAAARMAFVSVTELAAELRAAIGALGSDRLDTAPRHRTLRDTIDWSYRLLNPDQQAALVRFVVFAGGSKPVTASEVTGAAPQTLEALVIKSLLVRRLQPDGATRLTMLETIRQHVSEQLHADPDEAVVRRRHLHHYFKLVEQATAKFHTHQEAAAIASLDQDADNVRAALAWALTTDPAAALGLAGRLADYWRIRGQPDVLPLLEQALRTAGGSADAQDRARAHLQRSGVLALSHRYQMAEDAADDALACSRCAGDDAGISEALIILSTIRLHHGETQLARVAAAEALRRARAAGDGPLTASALARLATFLPTDQRAPLVDQAAQLLSQAGDYRQLARVYMNEAYNRLKEGRAEEATGLLETATRAQRRSPTPASTMFIAGNLGLAHLFCLRIEAARQAFRQQLELCLDHTFRFGTHEGLAGFAAIAAHDGDDERGALLLGAARALGYPTPFDQPIYARLERDFYAPSRARCGPRDWDRSEQAGAGLSHDEAIARALSLSPSAGGDPATPPRAVT